MDLNPHFHALDIILGYLNHGNSALEIKYLSSVAEAWRQQYHPFLLDYTPSQPRRGPLDSPLSLRSQHPVLCPPPLLQRLQM
ncbi:hypothetical protein THARTR1_04754 [Trichoderma harzianum]|uniref:Uncharacterized protein n=1 Tax=Trichoderma harzianum TaxID=5544 RepID=A0A2K0UBB1_TRIHA|nr:hypothetical protein THARTR1_04754 [Trichoderma harzianum]